MTYDELLNFIIGFGLGAGIVGIYTTINLLIIFGK